MKANKLLNKKIYRQIAKKEEFDLTTGHEPYPYVIMTGTGRDMGKIYKTNLLFSILVGWSREEILGKKINNFMPELFAQYHDCFVNNYFTARDPNFESPFLEIENELFVKNKGGYINSVILMVKQHDMHNTSGNIYFLGYFKTETTSFNNIFILC